MLIVEPNVEYWEQKNPIEHVCKCAQISYQSESKTGEDAKKFYEALKNRGHYSVFRHESCYYKIHNSWKRLMDITISIDRCPYADFIIKGNYTYIVTNKNYLFDNNALDIVLEEYLITPEEFKKECPELFRPTFCLTTQIATSREVLLRTSPQNITEMSTRYIKFGGKVEPSIVRPWWMTSEFVEEYPYNKDDTQWGIDRYYAACCENSFKEYKVLLKKGMKPEDARGLLPLDTMTKIVGTYTIAEWSHILQLRLLGTTGKPQGNAKVIAELIYQELQKLGYKFNENNKLVYE